MSKLFENFTFWGFFTKEADRLKNVTNIKKIAPELLDSLNKNENFNCLSGKEKASIKKALFSEDSQNIFREKGFKDFQPIKGAKEIFLHFFAMNENWPIGRNILGGLMVHSPEFPTYFIPAFTQAKATGDAGHLKKGEGIRGLITGGLEGIAVGALVSGKRIKLVEMGPYILLGAGLQLFSSIVFPWIGEKAGQLAYKKNHPNLSLHKTNPVNTPLQQMTNPPVFSTITTKPAVPKFAGLNLYKNPYNSSNGRMKII